MPTHVLGISSYYHDSAACLMRDGEIVAAAQEERFTRIKHDSAFPARAVEYCLREAGITPTAVDHVVFYEKPLLKFDRLLETYLAYAPRGLRSFMHALPVWLKTKLHLQREIRAALGDGFRRRIAFTGHHEAHAASAFFPSPFDEAAVLTIDGVGEWETASISHGRGNDLKILQSLTFPHSLGLLYSAFTYHCGFKVNSGEYKLMGLAPYGEPRFVDGILEHLIDLREDGSFRLNMRYFSYAEGLRMTSRHFSDLFEGPSRQPESRITQREMDLAASVQKVTELIVLRMARHARELTGARHLCLAGGVALNCVANGRIVEEGIFDEIWIQPASGDAGGALGAAMLVSHQLLGFARPPCTDSDRHGVAGRGAGVPAAGATAIEEMGGTPIATRGPTDARALDRMKGALLGPEFQYEEIAPALTRYGIQTAPIADPATYYAAVATHIAEGKVVGWFQGRMEFGPRALGARSILGDPRLPEMQRKMNLRIKFRESFRPFAPVVLAEDAPQYFALQGSSPYMLVVAPVAKSRRIEVQDAADDSEDLLAKVNACRSKIPAVTHVDYSARVQTVDERHPQLRELLLAFRAQTGCSVLINTSFNVRGEPLVCNPEDAVRCFLATEIDVLAIGSFLVTREDIPKEHAIAEEDREAHLRSFALD